MIMYRLLIIQCLYFKDYYKSGRMLVKMAEAIGKKYRISKF